ncbi:MAG: hypothetical protein LQ351_000036 [Letrouitia transgressa]|nr:MAG: hypothetical protein LQ351_000036 [Letrouitia transgressa]
MTRQKLNQLVILHDKDHYITDADAASKALIMETEADPTASQERTSIHAFQEPLSPASNSSDESVIHFLHPSRPSSPSVSPSISDTYSDLGGVPLSPSVIASSSEWSLLSIPRIDSIADDGLSEPHLAAPLSKTPSTLKKQGLVCPLCPPDRQRRFGSILAFEMHLNSAAHAPKVFHCPMAFSVDVPEPWDKKKERYFSTLSGLTRHLEVGACSGGRSTFRSAIEFLEEQLLRLGIVGVKLLVEAREKGGKANVVAIAHSLVTKKNTYLVYSDVLQAIKASENFIAISNDISVVWMGEVISDI